NGACVRTVRPWKQDTRVLVKSSLCELLARARVVYCRTLTDNTFAVGLEFLARTDAWGTGRRIAVFAKVTRQGRLNSRLVRLPSILGSVLTCVVSAVTRH